MFHWFPWVLKDLSILVGNPILKLGTYKKEPNIPLNSDKVIISRAKLGGWEGEAAVAYCRC